MTMQHDEHVFALNAHDEQLVERIDPIECLLYTDGFYQFALPNGGTSIPTKSKWMMIETLKHAYQIDGPEYFSRVWVTLVKGSVPDDEDTDTLSEHERAMVEDLEGDLHINEEEAAAVYAGFQDCFGDSDNHTADQVASAWHGNWKSKVDYTHHWVDDAGLLDDIPENLRYYFDYELYAKDLFLSDLTMSSCNHVFTRNW